MNVVFEYPDCGNDGQRCAVTMSTTIARRTGFVKLSGAAAHAASGNYGETQTWKLGRIAAEFSSSVALFVITPYYASPDVVVGYDDSGELKFWVHADDKVAEMDIGQFIEFAVDNEI